MKINRIEITGFKSKAYPVAPFVIRTKRGRLNVAEASSRDIRRDGFFLNLARFFARNFASLTKDPNWEIFRRGCGANYDDAMRELVRYYHAKIKAKDSDMTLLLAKDKRNKIQGACLSYGYDRIPDVKDRVCYIDSIAVNPAYRGFNIGQTMMEKTLNSAGNNFSDAFLSGDKMASGFYTKLGFQPLDKEDESQRVIIDYISRRRSDYPEYIDFFNIPLNERAERWYNVVSKDIE